MANRLLFKPEDYTNQLSFITLSSEQIRNMVASYSLKFYQVRDKEAEWGVKFPPFIRAFYNFVYKWKRIPRQEEFFDFYLSYYSPFFDENNFSQKLMNGLKYRAFRAYPSFVRDIYFNKLLEEQLQQYKVFYNIKTDLRNDVDALLIKDGRYWSACLYTDTKNGDKARDIKDNRHERFSNVTYVEFPVTFSKEKLVGEFFLYGVDEMNELLSHIQ